MPSQRTADSDRLGQGINADLQRVGDPGAGLFRASSIPENQLPDALRRALGAFRTATGTRVHIFRNLTPEILDFNGVNFRDGTVHINENSQNPATLTAAHEWVHNLRRTNPVALFNRCDSLDQDGGLEFVRSADQTPVQPLNNALAGDLKNDDGRNAYEAVELPDSLSGIREAFQAAFGRDIRPVAPTDKRFDIFNGIYIHSQPRAVYVNVSNKVGFVTIAGHELLHEIKRDRPDLIAWYRSVARDYYKNLDRYQQAFAPIGGGFEAQHLRATDPVTPSPSVNRH